ncbi:MAG: hypothetical protein FD119_4044 [Stygiobacter sp.]|nr:MAG: hypothetical protein FD119_4044 [Stygiobacter sp.]
MARGCGGDCDCPYDRNAPLTEAGWQTWELLTGSIGAIRLGPRGGITGLDLPALLIQAQALGYDQPLLARLLPFAERGMVAGAAKAQTET